MRASQDRERRNDSSLYVWRDDVAQEMILVVFVLNLEIFHGKARRPSGVHVWNRAVVGGYMGGHGEHLWRAAVVAGQCEHGRFVECVGQAGEECGVGAVPAIDGLQRIADDEYVFSVAAKCFEESVLKGFISWASSTKMCRKRKRVAAAKSARSLMARVAWLMRSSRSTNPRLAFSCSYARYADATRAGARATLRPIRSTSAS